MSGAGDNIPLTDKSDVLPCFAVLLYEKKTDFDSLETYSTCLKTGSEHTGEIVSSGIEPSHQEWF